MHVQFCWNPPNLRDNLRHLCWRGRFKTGGNEILLRTVQTGSFRTVSRITVQGKIWMIELVREQCGLRNSFISHNRYRPNNRLVWNQENQENVLRTLFGRIRCQRLRVDVSHFPSCHEATSWRASEALGQEHCDSFLKSSRLSLVCSELASCCYTKG